jgi:cyclin-dependent kinase regulatory subunit CKS1
LGCHEAFGARNRRSDRSRRADTAVPARAPGSLSCNPHGPLLPHRKVQPTDRETPRFFRLPARDRHVVLPPDIAKLLPKGRLLSEAEWRGLGVQQSRGWVHYAIHRPEPHIMLYRRTLNYGQPALTDAANKANQQ